MDAARLARDVTSFDITDYDEHVTAAADAVRAQREFCCFKPRA